MESEQDRDAAGTFAHAPGFVTSETSGGLALDRYEAYYEELFADAMQDGVITAEERAQLHRAADELGLDRERLRKLELALSAAYEMHRGVRVREQEGEPAAAPASLVPLAPPTDQRTLALERRVAELEARVRELEHELEQARASFAVEVDVGEIEHATAPGPAGGVEADDPAALERRLRHDPRDVETLRALYGAWGVRGEVDRQWGAACALAYLGAGDAEVEASVRAGRPATGLIEPKAALDGAAWRRMLMHPDEDLTTGEIFGCLAPALLLGRVAVLRHLKALPEVDPSRRQDAATSTVQAVRCFSWAAAILGMVIPPLYVVPEFPGLVDMVPGVPPLTRLGKAALSGRSAHELAYACGRQLAYYREERFVRLLYPSVVDLEEAFLAALVVGNPGLPLAAGVKARVEPIAKAIEPLLERTQVDRLRGAFLRFVEDGGRTNLGHWAAAADATARRAGLLLCGDLTVAEAMTRAEDPRAVGPAMDDLLTFVVSDRYHRLRKALGIACEAR
ncbi:MAG: hypothetical protein HY908_14690 [Myxococcales bacterium]|nr:hypothetical protein [Myxococcales bacterium]